MREILNNLQGLRAYAASSVLLVHLLPIFHVPVHFGLYGVDVFFVLSGFLMAMIAARDSSAFLRRRLIRIIPLYWLCTLGVFVIAVLKPDMLLTTTASVVNLIKSLAFVPYRKEGGVMQPMLFLGWTLNYEMYFYLIFGVILSLRLRKPSLWVAGVIAIPPLVVLFGPASDLVRFYGDPIVLEFVLGMAAYHFFDRYADRLKSVNGEIWLLLLCLVCLPCVEAINGTKYRAILLGLPAAGVVIAAALLERNGVRMRQPLILLVGGASYALYLTHPYVLQVGEKVLHCGEWGSIVGKQIAGALLVGAAIGFACVLHVWFELPVMRKLKQICLRPQSIGSPGVGQIENVPSR